MFCFSMYRLDVEWQVMTQYSTDLDSNARPDRLNVALTCEQYCTIYIYIYTVIVYRAIA